MAWYRDGTVRVTNGSATVTGTGTLWGDNKQGIGPGQMFLLPGAGTVQVYEILRVDSNTQITLKNNFSGSTAAASAYAIPSFYTDSVPDFARRLAAQLSYYQSQMDGWQQIMTGAGTISITAPDGTIVQISSFKKLTDDMNGKADKSALDGKANKGANSDITSLSGLTTPLSPEQGGTGGNNPTSARSSLGVSYGKVAGTVAQGNDVRLDTIEGKSGGAVTGNIYAKTISNSTGVSGGDITSVVQNTVGAANTQFKMFAQLGSGGQRYGFLRLFQDAAYKDWYFDYSSGNAYAATSWQNSCDVRIKDLITRISNPLVRMRKIKGCTWVRKDDQMKGAIGIGLIAQDVLDAFSDIPEVVSHSRQGSLTVDGVEVEDPLAISPGDVSAALHHEAILALMDKIEALEEKVASLEKGKMG